MTKKFNAYLVGTLLLLPLTASAGELPSLVEALATLKATPASNVVAPAGRAVLVAQAQTPSWDTAGGCGDTGSGCRNGWNTGGNTGSTVDIWATPKNGPAMVSMVGGKPTGAYVYLTVENGSLNAIFVDPRIEEAPQTINYVFSDVTVANNEVLYHGLVIGRIKGSATIPPGPVLDDGYSLKFSYGGTIDANTGADRAFVNVEIVSASH